MAGMLVQMDYSSLMPLLICPSAELGLIEVVVFRVPLEASGDTSANRQDYRLIPNLEISVAHVNGYGAECGRRLWMSMLTFKSGHC